MQNNITTYKIIAENALDPIFLTDTEGTIRFANRAAEKVFGYGNEEFVGSGVHALLHHSHADGRPFAAEDCPLSHAYARGEAVEDLVQQFIRKDGRFVIVSCSLTPVFSSGETRGHVLYVRDISRRAQLEQARFADEARFRVLTDAMPQMVWELAPDGSVTFINERSREYFGEIGDDFAETIHPEDIARSQQAWREALGAGTEYRIEHRIRRRDGVYRWFLSHAVPFRDESGLITAWYGVSTDIDDIRRAGEVVRKSRETLRLATEAANLGLWDYYPQTDKLVWNESGKRLFGLPADASATLEGFLALVDPDDRQRVQAMMQEAMHAEAGARLDLQFRAAAEVHGLRWFRVYGKSIVDASGKPVRFIGVAMDITDIKLAEQRIRDASQRDTLTGLPNRALLFEYCGHLLAIARRTRSNGALLFIDLDRFKPINDTHGHDVGDQVLRQVAKRLLDCTRQEDIVGRLGGDEFVVALPHSDDTWGPATVARNLIERISQPYYVGNLQLQLSPSIGISLYPAHGESLDALIKCADAAMYEAKKSGPGRYRFYSPTLDDGSDQQLAIERRLREALDNNELVLHYQPVVDLESGRPTGVEALLRLPVPGREPLLPHQFMPAAESAGLVGRLGEWVAREACRQHQAWIAAGLPSMSVAINVAPQQFRQRSFVSQLADSVRNCGMDPSCLQVELKESTVLEDVPDTIAALQELRALGISVALDDFGVGYSSIGLLSTLPIDKLKIDQSFVNRIGQDAKSQAITDTVLALGRSLHLQVVGEGIESEEVFDYLRDQGCDQAQGYFFSKPLSAEAFEHWYRDSYAPAASLH
ncbi:sensor domain-containing protein [Noviherbaspirillum aridicola]|uniref:GGDEF domain-containing protein n=1 Tax=Noviherbaspirillum aridicola TaxID=2849687 RepID=A0ABQ4Q7C7_9BURK|nr:GGDEF and EAL domain-containing protein [Noviherbaspirillum aridicola]GIZ53129.1 GGDEF domain-containing protein [Noviherbaspirillum aridicola]